MILELSSLAEVEEALRAEGFFGAEGVVADVYLGYGLSAGLRRETTPAPPEPCPRLPAAAVSIRPDDERQMLMSTSFEVGAWTRSWTDERYAAAVEAVRESIARGDVYQVNLVQHLSAPFRGDPAGLAAALAPLRPSPPRAARRRRLGGRLRLARALPRARGAAASGRVRSRGRRRQASRSSRRRTWPST